MKVLVIEDDVRLGELLSRALKGAGLDVTVAHDGDTGYMAASGNAFDGIILDLTLPDMDGLELCRGLRDAGVSTPILILTARSDVPDRVAGLEAGADDYLGKPFALEEFMARVRALLRRGPTIRSVERLEVGDLVLDYSCRDALRQGRRLNLTPREFAVLECLMLRPGHAVSRDLLLERVWGEALPETNVVDVTVRRLRQKVDAQFEPKLLETVKGYGYRIAAPPS